MNIIPCFAFNDRGQIANARVFNTPADVEAFLAIKYSGSAFGQESLMQSGEYRENALCYDFREFLKWYLVLEHGHYRAYYAPSVAALREAAGLSRSAKVWVHPE